mgnify:CR=1 FL=1
MIEEELLLKMEEGELEEEPAAYAELLDFEKNRKYKYFMLIY